MNKMKKIGKIVFPSFSVLAVLAIGVWALEGCGTGIGTPYTYSSTSTTGDYAEWTVTAGNISVVWEKTDPNNGAVTMTYNVQASCGAPDATYGYQTCTIYQASCTNGTQACNGTPSGQFDMMQAPGVALFVHTPGSGTNNDQLHVGIVKDNTACSSDLTGYYTYIRAGTGLSELFGMYHSDSNLVNVNHADFAMSATSGTNPQTIVDTTSDTGGNASLGDSGCSGGVRTRTISGKDMRAMMTRSGLFMFDMPSGQGGLISFRSDRAASISDFAGKSFAGISFPDNSAASPVAATAGSYNGTGVPIAAQVKGMGSMNLEIRPVTVANSLDPSPAYPDFTVASGGTYSSNTLLSAAYPTPSTIPGLFKLETTTPTDTGRVVMGAMKYNGKIIGFGVVYNWRDTTQYNQSTGANFTTAGLYNTGNFLLFEK